MFGKGYIVDFCISLFQKEENERLEKEYYIKTLSYMAQGIEFISHNTAYIPAQFKCEAKVLLPFVEFLKEKQEERTATEIVDDVLGKCGL